MTELYYKDAVDIRNFIVAVCPAGHKARNISKTVMGKIDSLARSAQQPVTDAVTGKLIGKDKLTDFNFILLDEHASEVRRAFDVCLDYVEVLLKEDNFTGNGRAADRLFVESGISKEA